MMCTAKLRLDAVISFYVDRPERGFSKGSAQRMVIRELGVTTTCRYLCTASRNSRSDMRS